MNPERVRVAVGFTNLEDPNLITYGAEKLIQHEKFTSSNLFLHNIALIKVKGKIAFNAKVQAIKLPESKSHAGNVTVSTEWGSPEVRITLFKNELVVTALVFLFANNVFSFNKHEYNG